MGNLPPNRRDRPVGKTSRGEQVFMTPEFWRLLEGIQQTVGFQDGAAPGSTDFVMFPHYSTATSAAALASYGGGERSGAVMADYQQSKPAAVTAQYAAPSASVSFARY